MTPTPHIRILMGTRNGAAHLSEQLASLRGQSHRDWSLWVSDDGSDDATPEILDRFRSAVPEREVRVFAGPGQGAAANYLALLGRVERRQDMLVALSDQDDVWLPDKLTRAAAAVAAAAGAEQRPVAYAAAYLLADERLCRRRPCRPCPAGPSFRNALVQNILSGHSLVLNAAALALVQRSLPAAGVPFHDWWIYQVTAGAGARLVYDPRPALIYRQHRDNLLGGNRSLAALRRRRTLLRGDDYRRWIDANLRALQAAAEVLSPVNRDLAQRFAAARRRPGPARAAELVRLGLHRQTRSGTAALLLAAALGRI